MHAVKVQEIVVFMFLSSLIAEMYSSNKISQN